MCLEHFLTKSHLPAAKGSLQQGGDAHAKENGANQLTGCPLIMTHTHGFSQQEGNSDSSTEAGKVVLRRNYVERKEFLAFYRCNEEHQILHKPRVTAVNLGSLL